VKRRLTLLGVVIVIVLAILYLENPDLLTAPFGGGGSEVVLGRAVRDQGAAGLEQALGLAVDVVVVEADRREGEARGGGHRETSAQRFIADMATPRMIRRWKNRKNRNTGTSESVDMANSWPQAESPVLSTKARSASGTV